MDDQITRQREIFQNRFHGGNVGWEVMRKSLYELEQYIKKHPL